VFMLLSAYRTDRQIHAHTCIYVCISTDIHIHTHTHTYTHSHTHIHIYIYIYIYIYIRNTYIHTGGAVAAGLESPAVGAQGLEERGLCLCFCVSASLPFYLSFCLTVFFSSVFLFFCLPVLLCFCVWIKHFNIPAPPVHRLPTPPTHYIRMHVYLSRSACIQVIRLAKMAPGDEREKGFGEEAGLEAES
jgi:hypothetical protein